MTLSTLAWLGMAAYAAHILEEYTFDWRGWSQSTLGLPVQWNDFYVTNAVVISLGIAQAMLAPTLPLAAIAFSGLMFINGVFMHIFPFLRTGRFSPGVITSVLLFLPQSIAMFHGALKTGAASIATLLFGFLIGAAALAFPIGMLMLRSRPYFRQTPVDSNMEPLS
ncbi:HXXEE domain-containing protein [Paraburkholderia pallida]|uniref:HXXEE domain-containing protein n=1 Tax=Paraburkholderia pallida TaxID=2547399 RepID=UPI0014312BF3|nr:HXXEE domain-containing protein [Paraburkholderia pallida]